MPAAVRVVEQLEQLTEYVDGLPQELKVTGAWTTLDKAWCCWWSLIGWRYGLPIGTAVALHSVFAAVSLHFFINSDASIVQHSLILLHESDTIGAHSHESNVVPQ